jgi:hypothetical protein
MSLEKWRVLRQNDCVGNEFLMLCILGFIGGNLSSGL